MIYSYDEHTSEEWTEFHSKLHNGERVEIDESMFDYYLDVLPPIFMNRTVDDVPGLEGQRVKIDFGFAEGADVIIYFWKERTIWNSDGKTDGPVLITAPQKTRYFCQRSKHIARGG